MEKATCHPDFEYKMKGAIVSKEFVVRDANIITGNGLRATFQFAFELVKILAGEQILRKIKKDICYIDN